MIIADLEKPSPIETVVVELGEQRSYPIYIGRGLIENARAYIAPVLNAKRFAVVVDGSIPQLAEQVMASFASDHQLLGAPCVVRPGEGSKSFESLERVCDALLDRGIERNHAVIAIGGGVVGDLAGFAAAIVKRGVKIVQVPTTLLAQVDSSVGGKTGINAAHGKNLIGAFHHPSLVLADIGALDTLSPREFRACYAEVVKYGALGDADFFTWLEVSRRQVFERELEGLTYAIKRSCAMKAAIVGRDERETGERALLNLGHTFGHAVEAWGHYTGSILHGEAVALGMVLAAEFSHETGLCSEIDVNRLRGHLQECGFAISIPMLRERLGKGPSAEEMMHYMEQDKKVQDGEMTFILMRGIGHAFIARDVPRDKVLSFLQQRI